MTEYVHYRTAVNVVGKGIVLKDHDRVESTGSEGLLLEIVGLAPYGEQPEGITEHAYEIAKETFESAGPDDDHTGLHIVHPFDILKRWCE